MFSSSENSTGLGFVLGLLGGAALSCMLVGVAVGYSLAGGMGRVGGGAVADVPAVPSAPDVPAAPSAPPAKVTERDHVLGKKDAKITLIEYSDFECPFCKRHTPVVMEVYNKYKDDVNIVYRHFPLSFHANAQKEAEASECVAELGGNDAFWKFHDYIFEKTTSNGTGFALDQLPVAAKDAGVDAKKFQTCLDSGKFAKYVQDQMQEGITAGVQGTPGNFVIDNDTGEAKAISGAVPATTFTAAIDAILAK